MTSAQLHLGQIFPNITGEAYYDVDGDQRKFDLYKFMSGKWCIIFSHPADYTPVCTTELGEAVKLLDEFEKRNCKLVALSCNDYITHQGWSTDILDYAKKSGNFPFPIIVDADRSLATSLGIMDPEEKDIQGLPLTCRALFFISPDRKVKAKILYPATTGRSFREILRVLDSLQLTSAYPVATPEGWMEGGRCMVVPTLTDDKAKEIFKDKKIEQVDLPSKKNYMRFVCDPR